ncbi:hypothetical protein BMF94_6688, partial [Rhodotorula taiwanensis]
MSSSSAATSSRLLVPIESAPGLEYSPDLATDQDQDGYFVRQHSAEDRDRLRKQRRKRHRRMYGGGNSHHHDSFVLTPPAPG